MNIEETEEEIIVVGHKVKKAKNIATYCKRAENFTTEDDEFMKDNKPIVLFRQGRKSGIRADCKRFIKKRPKALPPSDAATTAAISGVAVVTPQSPG
jgi:hypothetical protein